MKNNFDLADNIGQKITAYISISTSCSQIRRINCFVQYLDVKNLFPNSRSGVEQKMCSDHIMGVYTLIDSIIFYQGASALIRATHIIVILHSVYEICFLVIKT